MKRICIFFLLYILLSAVLFAGGRAEETEFAVPVPDPVSIPDLPSLLVNEDDFQLVLDNYEVLLVSMDPLIESLIFNGIEVN